MRHPDLARDPLPITHDFTGAEYTGADIEQHSEELEDLYPIIEDLKDDDWFDIPQSYLPMQDTITEPSVEYSSIPRTHAEALKSADAASWTAACDLEHEALIRNGVYE